MLYMGYLYVSCDYFYKGGGIVKVEKVSQCLSNLLLERQTMYANIFSLLVSTACADR